jgi:hypothetical protein
MKISHNSSPPDFSAHGARSHVTMDDLEFDFEDDIKATDVGQPEEAPEDLPDRAKKNYRQVRPTARNPIPFQSIVEGSAPTYPRSDPTGETPHDRVHRTPSTTNTTNTTTTT